MVATLPRPHLLGRGEQVYKLQTFIDRVRRLIPSYQIPSSHGFIVYLPNRTPRTTGITPRERIDSLSSTTTNHRSLRTLIVLQVCKSFTPSIALAMVATKHYAKSPPSALHKQHPVGPTPQMRENIPRPRNPWIIYRSTRLAKMRGTDESGQKLKPQAGISKDLATEWANEPPEVRRHYIELAELEKKEHKRKYPHYKFMPLSKEEKAAEREAAKLEKSQRREAEKAQRKEIVKRRAGAKRGVRSSSSTPCPVPYPPVTSWVPDQPLVVATDVQPSSLLLTSGAPPPFPSVSPFAAPDPSWFAPPPVAAPQLGAATDASSDASATLGAENGDASVNDQESTNATADVSRVPSPLPTSFDEAAARMSSWTFPGKEGTTTYDPNQYLSLWPSIESGPYGSGWSNPQFQGQGEDGSPSNAFRSNVSGIAAAEAAAQGFSIENSVRIEMPIPLSLSSTQPSPLTASFDFQSFTKADAGTDPAGSSSSAIQHDLPSQPSAATIVPSSEPFTFNLNLNPSSINEDGIINLAWGDYQEAYGGPDHAAQFFETLASPSGTDMNVMGYGVDSNDASYGQLDFGGAWGVASGSDSGTYSHDTQRHVSGAGEVEGTQFMGNLPASSPTEPSFGTYEFQFGGERTVSEDVRARAVAVAAEAQTNVSSDPSSSWNYTGPIDFFSFQAHLQGGHHPSGTCSNEDTYRNELYTPPSGAANVSRRVGGSWRIPKQVRILSSAAASSSSGCARMTAQGPVDGTSIWEEFDFSTIPASSGSRVTGAVSARR